MLDSFMIDRMGKLVSTIGSPAFNAAFYDLLRDGMDIEDCTVFAFPEPAKPRRLLVECDCEEARQVAERLADDYVAEGYRQDPNVRRITDRSLPNVQVIDCAAIEDEEYRRHYYSAPSVGHELMMLGDVDGTTYYTGLYRRQGRAAFDRDAVRRAESLAGFLQRALHRHCELMSERAPSPPLALPQPQGSVAELRERTLQHLREVLLAGPDRLSNREAEVCAGIVLGYSTLAIGLNFSISPNTVATHRKRAYAKMGISSQNELFARYFDTVRAYQGHSVQ